MKNAKARVLVLGATGLTGGNIAETLDAASDRIEVVRAFRNQTSVENSTDQGLAAVHLDLDDPVTFPDALEGVDRLFVMTGYTVAMTHQTKTITDAAAIAGVGHIVHLGVFGNGGSTDPHFAWHELVERYIEGSGVPWTHLHPHMFMENLLTTFPVRDSRLTWPAGDKPTGWVAGEDIAALGARVLADGADFHAGRTYWMSTDVLNGAQVAKILSQGLEQPITADVIAPSDLLKDISEGTEAAPSFMEANYAFSAFEWLQQTYDGRMDYSAVTTTDVEQVLGRPPIHLIDWAIANREALLSTSRAVT